MVTREPTATDGDAAATPDVSGHAATLAPDPDATVGSKHAGRPATARATIGRFVIIDRLGSGGMGVVHRARDPALGRDVAIKLLHAGDREHSARLHREAQAMARVQHRNLVTVFDVGQVDDEVFIAMEYVRGRTLREWLGERHRTHREIIAAFAEAGRGLSAAHDAGIVHRDFKPDNVLVASTGEVKVLDFGLAVGERDVDGDPLPANAASAVPHADPMSLRLTRTGALLGTPAYMAPEQFRGAATDARTDQFSFAVALFEALHGHRPFRGDTFGELASNVLDGVIAVGADDSVPPRVQQALARALSGVREDRWPDIDALIAELEASTDPPPGPRTRTRAYLAIGAVVAVCAVGIAAWYREPAAEAPIEEPSEGSDAANAALRALVDAPTEQRATQARAYLDTYGAEGSVAGRLIAEATLGEIAWRSSCARTGLLDLCVERVPADRTVARCVDGLDDYVVHERDATLREQALDHLRTADRLSEGIQLPADAVLADATRNAITLARTFLGDSELEPWLRLTVPRGLELSGDGAHAELSRDAFAAWFERLKDDGGRLVLAYASVKDHASAQWLVEGAARTGLVDERAFDMLGGMPIPASSIDEPARGTFCADNQRLASTLLDGAHGAYRYCVEKSDKHGVESAAAQWCRARLEVVASQRTAPR